MSAATLSAREVHQRIVQAVTEVERAEKNLVAWFGVMLERRLFRRLGYSSIYQYAAQELSFSRAKTGQLIQLCGSLEKLPALRRAVHSGEVPWTKARTLAPVATRATEQEWLDKARSVGRRELEQTVRRARRAARTADVPLLPLESPPPDPSGQAAGLSGRATARSASAASAASHGAATAVASHGTAAASPSQASLAGAGETTSGFPVPHSTLPEVPVTVSLRMTPAQYARYEKLLRKFGRDRDRAEIVLQALAAAQHTSEGRSQGTTPGAGETGKTNGDSPARGPASDQAGPCRAPSGTRRSGEPPYRIVLYRCEACGRGHVPTTRGDLPVAPAMLRQAACDSRQMRNGRNTAAIPPSLRRRILDRDGHRCRSAGCDHAQFLEVHHRVPRHRGGTNDPDNLITLCSACHRVTHDHDHGERATARPAHSPECVHG